MRALDYGVVVVEGPVVGESGAAAAVLLTKGGHVCMGSKSRNPAAARTRRQQQQKQQQQQQQQWEVVDGAAVVGWSAGWSGDTRGEAIAFALLQVMVGF